MDQWSKEIARRSGVCVPQGHATYRDRLKGMEMLLTRTQAGPGRTGKQEQEQTSRNLVQAF